MKYHIEKNTVQETLVIPLYGRKVCSERYPNLFRDETAIQLMDKIDYDFSALEQKSGGTMYQFGFLEVAMRQSDLAWEARDYLKTHPKAAVVNLGCGLDNTGRVRQGTTHIKWPRRAATSPPGPFFVGNIDLLREMRYTLCVS